MTSVDWKNTKLWERLEEHTSSSASNVRSIVTTYLPRIQEVLRQGGTAQLDFTLHDNGHSFRVAQKMIDIIPKESFLGLSPIELGLLLLSAYLHDIGMTPERKKVSAHYQYLLTGKRGLLADAEASEFQAWLDNSQNGVVPPLAQAQPTSDDLDKAQYIITHYSRAKHNDWSEEWIRNHMSQSSINIYSSWLDDLVLLCRSHHDGYHELKKNRFDPRPLANGEIVHLRYLACMLRIADILEFDPERTPDVIFQHRDPHPSSRIYWWKDHEISLVLEEGRVVMSARPKRAYLHRAIEITADQVDEELRICSQLASETHFDRCAALTKKLPHKWTLPSGIERDIEPYQDSYEYIDGAFRPDTNKILELLSGTELYGTPIHAVQEMLQNAFDAVREQIAYTRLGLRSPDDVSSNELGKQHFVRLTLENTDGSVWIVCEDNGVGMTKRIIADYLLVSGRGVRHEILDLERRCEAAGFSLGRTGQFGIGVLSYFMLASRVIFKTRRSSESGLQEPYGWRFESNGVGTFGELRKDNSVMRGTTVRLQLKPKVFKKEITGPRNSLSQYLREMLVRIPCRFEFIDKTGNNDGLSFGVGWIRKPEDFTRVLIDPIVNTLHRSPTRPEAVRDELLPLEVRSEREKVARDLEELRQEMQDGVRWESQEHEIANGLGFYRIHSCYFDLPHGQSLAFMRVRERNGILKVDSIGKGYSVEPSGTLILAWKGIRVGVGPRVRVHNNQFTRTIGSRVSHNCILEIDITSKHAGSIAVNRNSAQLDAAMQDVLKNLILSLVSELRGLVASRSESVYNTLNSALVDQPISFVTPPYWISIQKDGSAHWKSINGPLISSLPFAYSAIPPGQFRWRGRTVSVMRGLGEYEDGDHYKGHGWHGPNTPPDNVVLMHDYHRQRVVPLWENNGEQPRSAHPLGLTASFPPEWNYLVGVKFVRFDHLHNARIVWNRTNWLVNMVTSDAWIKCRELMVVDQDPLAHREWILSDRGSASSWIAHCLVEETMDLWNGLRDRDAKFLPQVFKLLGPSGIGPGTNTKGVFFYVEDGFDSRLRTLGVSRWQISRTRDREELLVEPGLDWELEYKPSESERESAARFMLQVTRTKNVAGNREKRDTTRKTRKRRTSRKTKKI